MSKSPQSISSTVTTFSSAGAFRWCRLENLTSYIKFFILREEPNGEAEREPLRKKILYWTVWRVVDALRFWDALGGKTKSNFSFLAKNPTERLNGNHRGRISYTGLSGGHGRFQILEARPEAAVFEPQQAPKHRKLLPNIPNRPRPARCASKCHSWIANVSGFSGGVTSALTDWPKVSLGKPSPNSPRAKRSDWLCQQRLPAWLACQLNNEAENS